MLREKGQQLYSSQVHKRSHTWTTQHLYHLLQSGHLTYWISHKSLKVDRLILQGDMVTLKTVKFSFS